MMFPAINRKEKYIMNIKGGTHLSKQDRNMIKDCVAQNKTCHETAKIVGKDERTISKEVKKRRDKQLNGRYSLNPDNRECKTIMRFPYVCNGCNKRSSCSRKYKYYYDPDFAHKNYVTTLSSSREGIDMTLQEKIDFDTTLKAGIDKGQSPYHIITSNPEKIKCSTRTAYRYIDKGETIVQNIDLRRKVKLKPRKHYKQKNKDNLDVREGRKYIDFISFFAQHPGIGIVEIDTVEGPKEGENKCLLTIHFTATHFMIGILLDSKKKECVNNAFLEIQKALGKELYSKAFSCVITDRGCEFVDADAIECFYEDQERVCNLFYCDSYSSYQKGAIEENHTLVRYIIPKGTSMNDFIQSQIDLLISHINSYRRASIASTPYELMKAYYGEEFLKKIRIECINPNDVTLKPSLLK